MNYDKSNPAFERIDKSNFSRSFAFDEYVGSFSILKQVDADGRRESSLHSTRCMVKGGCKLENPNDNKNNEL